MAEIGGQPGNQNALKARRWAEALKRALSRTSGGIDKGLDAVADKLIAYAMDGVPWAIEHIADRLDCRPKQVIEGKFEHEHTVDTGSELGIAERVERAKKARSDATVQ